MVDLSDADATLGRFDEALYWALRGIHAAGRPNPGFHGHAGVALLGLGVDSVTERWLLAGSAAWPGEDRLAIMLAQIDYLNGRDSMCVERLRRFVARHPESGDAASALAGYAALVGTPDAEALLMGRLKASPNSGRPGPVPTSYRALLALTRRRQGQVNRARALEDTAIAAARAAGRGREDAVYARELAAVYALRGNATVAVEWLDKAYQAGERDHRFLRRDPFFATVRRNPRVRALLERMAADVQAMQERARPSTDSLFLALARGTPPPR
jgi:hypothetical protein